MVGGEGDHEGRTTARVALYGGFGRFGKKKPDSGTKQNLASEEGDKRLIIVDVGVVGF